MGEHPHCRHARDDEQGTDCPNSYGMDRLDQWCPACRAEYDAWVDEQAERARLTDRACGLGWQWEHLVPAEN